MDSEAKKIRIQCDCGHEGHFLVIGRWFDEDEDDPFEMWAAVCEASRALPFWLRAKYAFFYLFGDDHLNYTEVVFRKEEMEKFIEKMNKL